MQVLEDRRDPLDNKEKKDAGVSVERMVQMAHQV